MKDLQTISFLQLCKCNVEIIDNCIGHLKGSKVPGHDELTVEMPNKCPQGHCNSFTIIIMPGGKLTMLLPDV